MISRMPIDELPSFIEENYNIEKPVYNPLLKYIIVGGVIIIAILISAAIVGNSQRNTNIIKPEENEN